MTGRNWPTLVATVGLVVALTAAVAPVAIAQPLRAEEPEEPQEEPDYPSEAWTAREAANYARTQEAPEQQASDPEFQQR